MGKRCLSSTADRADLVASAKDLFDVVESRAVKIEINQRFSLEDEAVDHQALEGRKTTSSTLLIP